MDDSHHCPPDRDRYHCRGILSLQMPYVRDLLQVNCEAKQKSVNMSILDIIIEIIALKLERFVVFHTPKICYII